MTKLTKFTRNMADYNLLTPADMDDLLFAPFRQALGRETYDRIQRQLENYAYYEGKQHVDPRTGQMVKANELPRPDGLDYDPTRYATNYFKAIVDRKARWQMGGTHGISVPRKQIDDAKMAQTDDYTPSEAQEAENIRAEEYERLLYRLWDENKMRARLIQAARDRLIADRVVCKIVFNKRTGKMRWVFRPDSEFIPVYSDDDFEDLIGAHFIVPTKYETKGGEVDAFRKQTYCLEDDTCTFEEAIYDERTLEVLETITEKASMGLDFIPIVIFPVNELLAESVGQSEISDLREQNDILNQMNEDAIDSMKFEMFPITVISNAVQGTADNVDKSPGALVEMNSGGGKDNHKAEMYQVESGFRWKDAFKDQYMRVKAAMHEISGLPQVVPQELNFGGLNGEALQVLYHDIITDTEEHWLSWGYNLAELHEKTIRYMQARITEPKFTYDKAAVRKIGNNYTNEMRFILPLPDNRKELVELLTFETDAGFESVRGAMERLGVENVQSKRQEIESERAKRGTGGDPYGEVIVDD